MATVTKLANANEAITTGYTDPTNAYADNGSYATAAPNKNQQVSSYYGFPAFEVEDIPNNSTINSVKVEIQFKVSTTSSVATQYLQVFINTSGVGSEQSNADEPTTDTLFSHTVTEGVTLANLREANVVRGRLRSARGNSNTAVTFSVDYVNCTVDYTAPPPVTKEIGEINGIVV